jgi:hypothetical protein
MNDEQPISSSTLYVRRRVLTLLKRREIECEAILARAYIEILKKLNGDVSSALRLFTEFTRTVVKAPVAQRRRGRADPELDARILAAGDAAPRRQREAAIAAAAGAKTMRDIDAARKRYDRLRAERNESERWLTKVVSAVRRKLKLHRPSQSLFNSSASAETQAPQDGDKYPF